MLKQLLSRIFAAVQPQTQAQPQYQAQGGRVYLDKQFADLTEQIKALREENEAFRKMIGDWVPSFVSDAVRAQVRISEQANSSRVSVKPQTSTTNEMAISLPEIDSLTFPSAEHYEALPNHGGAVKPFFCNGEEYVTASRFLLASGRSHSRNVVISIARRAAFICDKRKIKVEKRETKSGVVQAYPTRILNEVATAHQGEKMHA